MEHGLNALRILSKYLACEFVFTIEKEKNFYSFSSFLILNNSNNNGIY